MSKQSSAGSSPDALEGSRSSGARCVGGKPQRCESGARCVGGKPQRYESSIVKAEVRHDTLQDILYSQQSFEGDEIGAPSPRRHSPKVRPLNLDCPYGDNSPNIQDSFSIDRVTLRSQRSVARRVSFRSPDHSDIFIIPARNDPAGYYSSDEESTESISEEGIGAKRPPCAITRY
ncbi:unnamed protein product [Triticum turgidum subsp. durum]|uniref:Uncharacterized protein n=1 Tax=Triticum turgidum subsp. durum TaxID=4567 RepID=A0A9R0XBI7_TRITD|nr:unnamed protein product [Triticum turgidum subsp. durum]